MTDTTCPNCDAPAPPGARRCARCGYGFLEDGRGPRRPRPGRARASAALALAIVAAGAVFLSTVLDRGRYTTPIQDRRASAGLEVLSERPLSRAAAERVLAQRYLPAQDDDQADVHCSARIAKPAHSVRRCRLTYAGGVRRALVLLTNARGAEVLAEP
jgi:ribosomal protein L40E